VGSRLVGLSGEGSEGSDEGARGVRLGVEIIKRTCFGDRTKE
jgi:hypothetical protein